MSDTEKSPPVTKQVTFGNGRFCVVCDTPLQGRQTKYCADHGKPKQRVRRYRQKIKTRANNGVPVYGGLSSSEVAQLPDDLLSLSGREILALPYEATIRNTLLKAKLDIEEKDREIQRLRHEQEFSQDDRVLDLDTAKLVGRFLARRFDPSQQDGGLDDVEVNRE